MTQRGMSASYSTQLSQDAITIYHLYRGEFVDGNVYLTDLPYDTTFNGNTYSGVGSALGYDAIEEVSGLQANGIRLYFNASSAEILSLLLDQNLIDRPVYVYRGLLDSSNQPITDPIIIFEGRSDSMQLAEDPDKGTLQLTLECFDENVDFERVNGRRTNYEEQQLYFPGDKGFEFIADGMDKVTQW
jgi:hypothetical protein